MDPNFCNETHRITSAFYSEQEYLTLWFALWSYRVGEVMSARLKINGLETGKGIYKDYFKEKLWSLGVQVGVWVWDPLFL